MVNNTQRLFFLDLCRMIALWYMFFQHGYISVLSFTHWDLFTNLNNFVPICSALFLFICGFTLSINKNKNLFHQFFRLILYFILSICLFAFENGFQFPDIIFTSNILNTISILILFNIIISLFGEKIQIITNITLTIFFIIIFIYLDINHLLIFPLTNGYEPILPTLIFGFIGLSIGFFYSKCNNKTIFFTFLLFLGIIIVLIISFMYGYYDSFTAQIGRKKIYRMYKEQFLIQNLFTKTHSNFMTSIWNFNIISFISSLGSVFIIVSLVALFEKQLQNAHNIAFLPGKTAFSNYVFHLTVWAIIYQIFGSNCLNNMQFLIILLILFISSYFVGFMQLKIKNYIYHSKSDNFSQDNIE